MAQTGTSTEDSGEATSSLKPTEVLAKDGTDSQDCPDPVLPASTLSESGPSGVKPAERSSERKQPARASKRDIVFVRKNRHMCVSNTELGPACSPPPFSRVTVRETKSKVQDAPQVRQWLGSANGRPRERVIRGVSKGLPIVPRRGNP
jgi:hypothetical protein